MGTKAATKLESVRDSWRADWEDSLAVWSRFTKLSEPRWVMTAKQESKEGLTDSFAMIRLTDHAVVISFRQVVEKKLERFGKQIMAHEIGHHVYTPADLRDNARLLAYTRAGLPTREHWAGYISNLYTDLLINDRLQRDSGLDMAGVYKALKVTGSDRLWLLYMRIYEVLWSLPAGTLTPGKVDEQLQVDAQLGARVIRAYGKDWLDGAGRFAALCLTYLLEMPEKQIKIVSVWMDTLDAGAGGEAPDGMVEIDAAELDGAIHPSEDPDLVGLGEVDLDGENASQNKSPSPGGRETVGGQKNKYRSPTEYAELMKSIGVKLSESDLIIKYYRERAVAHVIKFPTREVKEASDPLPEGLDEWDVGSPIAAIDWMETVVKSPVVIPGVTTVERTYGHTEGTSPEKLPVDLFLGVDCSGSMMNPARGLSYPVLAGTVMVLSALRVGARVKVSLSGEPGEYSETDGFIRNEKEVLKTLTGYLGTGYAFGVLRLKDAFLRGEAPRRPTHVLVVTDSDIFHMLGEVKNGWEIAREALEIAGGGGTYVLNMSPDWGYKDEVKRMKDDGWKVHFVPDWKQLIAFTRAFSKEKYESGAGKK